MMPITACTGAPWTAPEMMEVPSARPNMSEPAATACTARPEPWPSPISMSMPCWR